MWPNCWCKKKYRQTMDNNSTKTTTKEWNAQFLLQHNKGFYSEIALIYNQCLRLEMLLFSGVQILHNNRFINWLRTKKPEIFSNCRTDLCTPKILKAPPKAIKELWKEIPRLYYSWLKSTIEHAKVEDICRIYFTGIVEDAVCLVESIVSCTLVFAV